MITEKKLKNEIKKLKEEIFNELPKEINAKIKAEHKIFIKEEETKYKNERQNLLKRGFVFKERVKPRSIFLHFGCAEYEIWEKDLGEMKI